MTYSVTAAQEIISIVGDKGNDGSNEGGGGGTGVFLNNGGSYSVLLVAGGGSSGDNTGWGDGGGYSGGGAGAGATRPNLTTGIQGNAYPGSGGSFSVSSVPGYPAANVPGADGYPKTEPKEGWVKICFGKSIKTIDAIDDTMGSIASSGGTTASVLAQNGTGTGAGKDQANGTDATTSNVTIKGTGNGTVATTTTLGLPASSPAAGKISLDVTNGTFTIAAGTPPGSYNYKYEICLNPATTPATCDIATATVNVGATINAIDDTMGSVASSGGTTASVLAQNGTGTGAGKDQANGADATTSNVTIKGTGNGTVATTTTLGLPASSPAAGKITLDVTNGTFTIAAGTPPGSYDYKYEICLNPATTPATCDIATATVTVIASQINQPANIPSLSIYGLMALMVLMFGGAFTRRHAR